MNWPCSDFARLGDAGVLRLGSLVEGAGSQSLAGPRLLSGQHAERAKIANVQKVWHARIVRKRRSHQWSAVLGMVAMLGALIAMPMTTSMALAMSAPMAASSAADEAPCHKPAKKPAKHCPDCPDMGTCLVKCFQPLSAPVAETSLLGIVVALCVLPEPSQIAAGSLIPPLLRPPSA
jgi:hypothetical protein